MRIALLCESGWSVESVYEGLSKELHKHDIDTSIYFHAWDNNDKYTSNFNLVEWNRLYRNFDYIIASPGKSLNPYYLRIGLPPEKTIMVCHSPWEVKEGVDDGGFDMYASLFVISNRLKEFARSLGITRDIHVVQNGIIFNRYCLPPAERLVNVGYGYPPDSIHKWKRSELVGRINGGAAVLRKRTHYSLMRDFYKSIDASLLVSSSLEACGLINMEAAAAGRLIISTDVGILEDYPHAPAIRVRMDEDDVVSDINNTIRYYKNHQDEFSRRCIESQEFAREYYDWSHAIKSWLVPINTLVTKNLS